MKTHAIKTQDTTRYPFGDIAKGIIGGGVLGYIAKNKLPLSPAEMDDEFKGAMTIIREQSNKAKAGAINTIRNIKNKSLAQDTFIKVVDAGKNAGIETGLDNIHTALKMRRIIQDANLNKNDIIELKGIIATVNEKAIDMYKRGVKAFTGAVKDKRITEMFVIGGAALGFFGGLAYNIMKPSNKA